MRTAPFAHYLPYWATRTLQTPDGELSVLVLVDGTFLVAAEVHGIDVYSSSNGAINQAAVGMRTTLNMLPPGAFLQAIWRTGETFSDVIEDYARSSGGAHAVLDEQRRRRADEMRRDGGLVRGKLVYWLGIKKALGNLRRDDATFFEKAVEAILGRSTTARGEITADAVQAAANTLGALQRAVFSQLERSGLGLRLLSEEGILQELQDALNPASGTTLPPVRIVDDPAAFSAAELDDDTLLYRPLSLREQLPCGDLTWEDDRYLLDEPATPHRVLSLQRLPPLTNPALCLGYQFASRQPLRFSLTALATDKERLTEQMIRRRNMMAAQAAGNVRDVAAEVAIGEFEHMLENMITLDQKLFVTSAQVVVSGRDVDQLDRATRDAKQAFSDLGAALTTESGRQMQAALATLPGNGLSAPSTRTLMTNNVADLLPYFEPSLGDEEAQFLYHTRQGGLRRVSMGSDKPNKNALVFGSSGSGKSFNVGVLFEELGLSAGCPVLIVDVQGPEVSNYRVLAELFGGSYTALSATRDISFNPFFSHEEIVATGPGGKAVIDEEKVAYLKKLVCVMALPAERSADTALAYDIARTAVLHAYKATRKKARPPLLRDVVAMLDAYEAAQPEYQALAREMFLNLSTWVKDPLRARLIDAPRNFEGTAPFQVFDFYGLERDRELATVLLLSVSFHIWATIQRYPRELTKYIVFDECWKLLTHPVAADIVAELYRTGRKWGASSWAITQDLTDFTNSPVSAALLANAPTVFLNKHVENHAEVARVCGLNARQEHLFRSLEFKAGSYSELLLVDRAKQESAVCRLKPTAFDLWLNTSKPEDVGFRERLQRERGLSLLEAIRACADEFPNGAPTNLVRKEAAA